MLKQGKFVFLVLTLVIAGLLVGVVHLLQLRFAAGDIYPPYSSLRADPLGTRALYESLDRLPGVQAERSFKPMNRLGEPRDTTLILAGVKAGSMDELPVGEFDELEQWATLGGRLVITLYPEPAESYYAQRRREQDMQRQAKREKQNPPGKRAKQKDEEARTPKAMQMLSLKTRWGLTLKYADLKADGEGGFVSEPATNSTSEASLPAVLSWHSALYAAEPTNTWRVLYARDGRAVVLERQFGQGSIVIATDSWHLSNEALRGDRQSAYLAWLARPGQRIVFDETHLGVQSPEGVATLARKYRLHGMFGGLLLLAFLFIWKNSTSFIPPPEELDQMQQGGVVAGRDSTAGFVNLLRRSIPKADILQVCLQEWQQAGGHRGTLREQKLERIRTLVAEESQRDLADRKPVERYTEIARIVAER